MYLLKLNYYINYSNVVGYYKYIKNTIHFQKRMNSKYTNYSNILTYQAL